MKKMYLFVSMLVAAVMLLTACGPAATPTAAPVAPATPAPVVPILLPTATQAPVIPPTPNPLGTAAKPIILALAPSATTQELLASGDAIATQLSKLTGYTFKTNVPTSYAALIEAMGSGNAQVGFMPTVPYIVAHSKKYADVGLVVLRNGADHYGFEFIANKGAGFKSYYDAATSKDTADAPTALAQFAGKKPCWTDPLSSSGYLVPAGLLASNKISVKAGAWVQGHPTVVTSVYLSPKGQICDFGAAYIDARSTVVKQYQDVNNVVDIIYVSDPIIPNDTVSYASSLPADYRQKITDALLAMLKTPDGVAAFKAVYQIDSLKAVDDSFYDDYRVYLQAINFDVNSYK
jgi:phosphonate transport system substrate-binding protein